jgi:prepilin signal peptidase PulO-like enzyme (type II secretory pathway)
MVVLLGVLLAFFLDGLVQRSLRCISIISKNYRISSIGYIRLYRSLFFYLLFGKWFGRFFVSFCYIFIVFSICSVNFFAGGDVSLQLLILLVLCIFLLIAVIDYSTKMIPDVLSYAVFWLGVLVSGVQNDCHLIDHLFVAVFAYAALKFLQQIYLIVFRKDAMGDADPLLAFGIGVWLDFWYLPYFFILAVFATLVPVVFLNITKGSLRSMEIPFGPGLALAGFLLIEFKYLNRVLVIF